MSDGVPTEEQLDRIRRGVAERIDRRQRAARFVAGTAVAVVLVGGGVGLVGAALRFGGGAAASGTAAGSGSTGSVVVRCHESAVRTSAVQVERADPAGLPRSAIEACGAVDFQATAGRMPTVAPDSSSTAASSPPTPAPSGRPAALCRDSRGVLHVYPSDARPTTLCVRNGMRAVATR